MIVSPCFEIKYFYLAVYITYIYIFSDCSTAVDIVLQRKVCYDEGS